MEERSGRVSNHRCKKQINHLHTFVKSSWQNEKNAFIKFNYCFMRYCVSFFPSEEDADGFFLNLIFKMLLMMISQTRLEFKKVERGGLKNKLYYN